MKTIRFFCLSVLALFAFQELFAQENPIAFKGAQLITVSGDVIDNGVIVVENGMIKRVGESGTRIPIAFQSGFEGYVPKTRVVLFEAAVAVANGLDRITALEKLTIGAAELLGISNRVGSLERGKDADVVLFNGDPFEYTTNVTGVIVDGAVVENE